MTPEQKAQAPASSIVPMVVFDPETNAVVRSNNRNSKHILILLYILALFNGFYAVVTFGNQNQIYRKAINASPNHETVELVCGNAASTAATQAVSKIASGIEKTEEVRAASAEKNSEKAINMLTDLQKKLKTK